MKNSIRILYIHSELGVLAGGGENFSRNLIKALFNEECKITILCTAKHNHTTRIPLPQGIDYELLTGYWNRQLGQKWLAELGKYLPQNKKMQQFWKKVQQGFLNYAIKWHNQRFRKRAISTVYQIWSNFDMSYIHGDPILAYEVAKILPTCLRLPGPVSGKELSLLKNIQVVCANGDALNQLQEKKTDNSYKIHELPIGLDSVQFSPNGDNCRKLIGWDNNQIIIGYTGRITVLKGVKLLVQAFCEVAKIHNSNLRLLIIGEGEEMSMLKSKLHSSKLDHLCYWAGKQPYESLAQWYRTMDLFVMPSLYENFSNAVLEAMGCGLPLLASNVGGNPLLIDEEKNGWLFTSGSSSHLAYKLNHAIKNRDNWLEMGKISREKIESQKYSWRSTAKTLLQIMGPHIKRSITEQ